MANPRSQMSPKDFKVYESMDLYNQNHAFTMYYVPEKLTRTFSLTKQELITFGNKEDLKKKYIMEHMKRWISELAIPKEEQEKKKKAAFYDELFPELAEQIKEKPAVTASISTVDSKTGTKFIPEIWANQVTEAYRDSVAISKVLRSSKKTRGLSP